MKYSPHRFCVAPMMEWTDRHCRHFHRLLTSRALLYTEMVTAAAIVHGDRERLLRHPACDRPVALQLGGADPYELARAVEVAATFAYDEVNLNVGCPSDRVQAGRFGACLMAEPELVAACITAMIGAIDVPITVKCRIGIDNQDVETDLRRFVARIEQAGCKTIIVHARKAWLEGLSPKKNREVPPLNYDRVYRLKQEFPELTIVINGGITSLDHAATHLQHVDGVMMGRAAYQQPYLLADVDRVFFKESTTIITRFDVVQKILAYARKELGQGVRLSQITRHIIGLYHGQPGARAFRRYLSQHANQLGAGLEVLETAISAIDDCANEHQRVVSAAE